MMHPSTLVNWYVSMPMSESKNYSDTNFYLQIVATIISS